MKVIKITDKHLADLQELLNEKEAVSDELVMSGSGELACDMNEVCDALRDLIFLAK